MHGPTVGPIARLMGAPARKTRRPAGVSRRRKKQLGFEPLEKRQVMSAESPLETLALGVQQGLQVQAYSYGNNTPEGALQILLDELAWQSLVQNSISNSNSNATSTDWSRALPTDPLLASQWHLISTGQSVGVPIAQPIFATVGEDINVAPIWSDNIFGNGVTVAVIDSGIQLDHPDLAGNINLALQFDPFTLGNNVAVAGPHGTAVAGLIGAIANGVGGVGVAPGVSLVPFGLIDGRLELVNSPETAAAYAAGQTAISRAIRYAIANDIDITNNSWGPADIRALNAPSPTVLAALRDSVAQGRDGKGMIHVWAAGNGAGPTFTTGFPQVGSLDSSNYDGYANNRYVISVTGVDFNGSYNNDDGTTFSYPEAGANVLVAAPTGSVPLEVSYDTSFGAGLTTTDLTGQNGYNLSPTLIDGEIDGDYLATTDYTSRFNGTSAAAPVVSGVIALMLEANADLTWRDVQEILVRSARQVAPLEVPSIAGGFEATQNPWIVNNTRLFIDPDPYFLGIVPGDATLNPIFTPRPALATNGAGYTVSQGRGVYGEEIGVGHGVVDAEMAVRLAQQWSTKNQMLPGEATYTTHVLPGGVGNPNVNTFYPIPAAEVASEASGFQIIPGGIGGIPGFAAYWSEYFVDEPFTGNPPPQNSRGTFIQLGVPPANTMSVEWVEVKVNLTGGSGAAMDNLRLVLVSPDGVHSELNPYFVDVLDNRQTQQNISPSVFQILPGNQVSVDTGDEMVWTFSSNRHWGERSDNKIVFDPSTGEPTLVGDAQAQGWRLYAENWGNTAFSLNDLEVTWHGSAIGANTRRIAGFVGVDQVRDDSFNFSRMIQAGTGATRYYDFETSLDQSIEAFAGNVTVTLRNTATGSIVDQFVTGADGNYYFDVIPGDYIVSIEDPLGRTALDDTTQTPAGFVKEYQNSWHITPEWFNVWDKVTVGGDLETPVDANGIPAPLLSGTGLTSYHVSNINFLLEPAEPQAEIGGQVYADLDGNGGMNAGDTSMANVTVYADLDNDGVRDATEPAALSTNNGAYNLVVPLTAARVVNVRVVPPAGWTVTQPTGGVQTVFAQLGAKFNNTDFGLKPPTTSTGGQGNGFILGSVFNDLDGDTVKDANEGGLGGFRVYIDGSGGSAPNGVFDVGERETTTNASGSYVFTDVTPGTKQIRVEYASPFSQTLPSGGGARTVSLPAGGTASGIAFGLRNSATDDYGDLPTKYAGATTGANAARHTVGVYYLGSVDAEVTGTPTTGADGDDNNAVSDESGIQFGTLTAGQTGQITVSASRNNGYLKGWVDWNDDGDFDDAGERLTFTGSRDTGLVTTNNIAVLGPTLAPGGDVLTFAVPAGAVANPYARFRYGSAPLNSVFGADVIGEVEDYRLTVVGAGGPSLPLVVGLPGDFDQNGQIDGGDILHWQRGLGMTVAARQSHGSADADGDVDAGDHSLWLQQFGATTQAAQTVVNPDFNGDNAVDGADVLRWQRGLGSAGSRASGDANGDGLVNSVDEGAWRQSFGLASSSSSASGAVSAEPAAFVGDASSAVTTVASGGLSVASPLVAGPARTASSATTGAMEVRSASARVAYRPQAVSAAVVAARLELRRRDDAVAELFGEEARLGGDDAADEPTGDAVDAALELLADHGQWPPA